MRALACIVFLFLVGLCQGQEPCYATLLEEGQTLRQARSYNAAINKFISARFCFDKPQFDQIDSLIKITQQAWVQALNRSIAREMSLADSITQAKQQVESLLLDNLEAKEVITRKADSLQQAIRISERQRIQAQAGHYMVEAEQARKDGDLADALYLAFRALELEPDTITAAGWRTFGEIVGLKLGDTLYQSDGTIYSIRSAVNPGQLLLTGKSQVDYSRRRHRSSRSGRVQRWRRAIC